MRQPPSTFGLAAVRRLAYEAADAGLLRAGGGHSPGERRSSDRCAPRKLAHARSGATASCAAGHGDGARPSRSRHARGPDRLRSATRRTARPEGGLDPATRGALGHRRPCWQGRPRADSSHPNVGEGCHRCVDDRGRHHRGDRLSRHQQDGAGLGRRDDSEGFLGCRPSSGGRRWHREAGAARPPPDVRTPSAISRGASWTRFSSCWDTCPSKRLSATSGANRSSGAP